MDSTADPEEPEILSQFQNRNNVLTLGSATLGILFNVAASVGKDAASAPAPFMSLQISASFVILALTVPLMTSLMIFLWGVYSSRVAAIGNYLMNKEDTLNARFGGDIFQWERRLRCDRDTDELRQAMAVTFVFTAISLISVILASQIGELEADPGIRYFVPCQVLSWVFLVVGFLIGDYRMYKIKQASLSPSSEKCSSLKCRECSGSKERNNFPFFMLGQVFSPFSVARYRRS